jgi:hypothetical protein
MKKNMQKTMDNLIIDNGIRDLIRQMWKHNYQTKYSCEGHSKFNSAYVMFNSDSGDGWFEKNSSLYGLSKREYNSCCELFLKEYNDSNCCGECGAGINGNTMYAGRLINNPFQKLNLDKLAA